VARQHRPVEVTESVDDLLLNIIDDTLKHVFKEAGTNVIYGYLGNKCHLNRDEIAEKPEVFSTGLKNLLGSGELLIEGVGARFPRVLRDDELAGQSR